MPSKVKSHSEIAREYGVHRNTLTIWLRPINEKLNKKNRKLLLPWQIQMIYDFLGHPNTYKEGGTKE